MSTNPKPQLHLTGLTFGESPRWRTGRLWVSDSGTRQLLAASQDGKREVMVTLALPSFQPICMKNHAFTCLIEAAKPADLYDPTHALPGVRGLFF